MTFPERHLKTYRILPSRNLSPMECSSIGYCINYHLCGMFGKSCRGVGGACHQKYNISQSWEYGLTSEQAFCPSQAVAQGFPKIPPLRYCLTRRSRASADLGGKSRDDDMTPFPRPELTKPVKTSHKLGKRHDLHPT